MSTKVKKSGIDPNIVLQNPVVSDSLRVDGKSYGPLKPLTFSASIAPDFAAGNNFGVTLTGNTTLAAPTGGLAGQSGVIVVTQDATGSRTMAFNSYWKFANGTVPTLSTAPNSVDVLVYFVESLTRISVTALKGMA